MAEMGSDSEDFETDAVPDTDEELTKTFQAQSIHDRSRNADTRPAAVEKSNTPEERVQISVAEEDHQQSDNDVDDLDMKKYRGRLPPELQADHHDGVILYFDRSDDDSIGAKNFLHDIMTKVELDGGKKPKVALFHDILPFTMALTEPKLLEIIIKRSTFKFLYITESFCNDAWKKFAASVCLMESIENEEWSVVPIFTTDKHITPRPYFISPTITGLKGFNNYNSATFPTEHFRNLIQAKLEYRMAQNADIEKQRIDAIKEMKDQEQKKSQGTVQASTISPQTTPPFSEATCSVSETNASSNVSSDGEGRPLYAKAGHACHEPPSYADHQESKLGVRTVMVGEQNQQITSSQPDSDGADNTAAIRKRSLLLKKK